MSTGQRIFRVLTGLLMIALGAMLVRNPETGFTVIAAILSLTLTIYGIRYLIYYFTMARFMVGGKLLLFVSIFALDFGAFTAALTDTPRIYIILYLIGIHAFSGVIDMMRGREARAGGSPTWKYSVASGAVNILIALACIVFLRSTDVLVYIYAAGLAYAALTRIVSALRRTAIVYIQ